MREIFKLPREESGRKVLRGEQRNDECVGREKWGKPQVVVQVEVCTYPFAEVDLHHYDDGQPHGEERQGVPALP